jgi:hypothetical protein
MMDAVRRLLSEVAGGYVGGRVLVALFRLYLYAVGTPLSFLTDPGFTRAHETQEFYLPL